MSKVLYFLKGSTCAPCKMFAPVLDKAVLEAGEDIEVRQETDNMELMQKFGVRQVPVVALVDVDGDKMDVFHIMTGSGLRKDAIVSAIKEFVADDGSF